MGRTPERPRRGRPAKSHPERGPSGGSPLAGNEPLSGSGKKEDWFETLAKEKARVPPHEEVGNLFCASAGGTRAAGADFIPHNGRL